MKTSKYYLDVDSGDSTLYVRTPLSKAEFNRQLQTLQKQAEEASNPDFPVNTSRHEVVIDNTVRIMHHFGVGMTDFDLIEMHCLPGYQFLSAK